MGPYKVLGKDWEKPVFQIQKASGPDNVSLERLKAADVGHHYLGEVLLHQPLSRPSHIRSCTGA